MPDTAGMYRFGRAAQSAGDLLHAALLQKIHHRHLVIGLPQVLYHLADRLGLGLAHRQILRPGGCRAHRRRFRHGLVAGGHHPPVPGALQMVAGFVGRDTGQPGLVMFGRAVIHVRKGCNKCILGQVLRQLMIPYQLVAHGIDQLLILLHQCAELCIGHSAERPLPLLVCPFAEYNEPGRRFSSQIERFFYLGQSRTKKRAGGAPLARFFKG